MITTAKAKTEQKQALAPRKRSVNPPSAEPSGYVVVIQHRGTWGWEASAWEATSQAGQHLAAEAAAMQGVSVDDGTGETDLGLVAWVRRLVAPPADEVDYWQFIIGAQPPRAASLWRQISIAAGPQSPRVLAAWLSAPGPEDPFLRELYGKGRVAAHEAILSATNERGPLGPDDIAGAAQLAACLLKWARETSRFALAKELAREGAWLWALLLNNGGSHG